MEVMEQKFIALDLPESDNAIERDRAARITGKVFTIKQYVRLVMRSGSWSNWPNSAIGGNNTLWGAAVFSLHHLSPKPPVGPCDLRKESVRSIGRGTDETYKGEQSIGVWSHVEGWEDRSLGGGFELIVDGKTLIRETYQPTDVSPAERLQRWIAIEVI